MTYKEAREYFLEMEKDRQLLIDQSISKGFTLGIGFRATEIEVMIKLLEQSLKMDCYFKGEGFDSSYKGSFLSPRI